MKWYPEIARSVDRFRHEYYLSDSEPINLYPLLLKLNVLAIFKPLSDRFSGMCLKSGEQRFVLINSKHPVCRQHFTIAHELYHLFIQEDITPHYCNPETSGEKDKNEKLADLFASYLLLPEKGLRLIIPPMEYDRKQLTIATLLKLEHYFQVSHQSLLIRLRGLNLLNESMFNSYMALPVIKTAIEYGYDASLYQPANEGLIIGDYGTKAKELFDAEKISEGHYRDLMMAIGVDVTDAGHYEK